MRTVLVFSGKGGVGKTTLAREMAVAGTLEGKRIAIADLDPQAGITGWFGRRAAETPVMIKLPAEYDLSRAADAGIDELLIDCPPGVPTYVGKLMEQVDVVLMPCRPSPDDLAAAAGAVDLVARHRSWAFVLTQTLPRSRLTDGALRQLAALGRVAPVSLGLRQDYPMAAINGMAAVEFSGTKSASEVTHLRAYVSEMIGYRGGEKTNR